jgi:hypothetical protein
MNGFPARVGDALLTAFGMFWDVGWSLVLGFAISGSREWQSRHDIRIRTRRRATVFHFLGRSRSRDGAVAQASIVCPVCAHTFISQGN